MYDAILLGQQVLEEEVFENVVTYTPLGKMEVKPARKSIVKQLSAFRESEGMQKTNQSASSSKSLLKLDLDPPPKQCYKVVSSLVIQEEPPTNRRADLEKEVAPPLEGLEEEDVNLKSQSDDSDSSMLSLNSLKDS